MNDVTLGGIELGKDAFHVYGQDKSGHAVLRKKMAPKQLMTFFGDLPARLSWGRRGRSPYGTPVVRVQARGQTDFAALSEAIRQRQQELSESHRQSLLAVRSRLSLQKSERTTAVHSVSRVDKLSVR
jgi:hypothetical protein